MRIFFFYFATLGWILSLVVHLFSVAHIDVQDQYPFVPILHIGIFVAWLPAVLLLVKNKKKSGIQEESANPITFFKDIFKETPVWLIIIAAGCFIYAFINFILYMNSMGGVVDIIGGQYVIHNHGNIIKELTEQEYHYYRAEELRGFSGHWLAFYGMAMAILYPFNTPKKANSDLITQ